VPSLSARRARGKRPAKDQLPLPFGGDQIPENIERWLPVPDWPGYEVSDRGRIRSYWGMGGSSRERRFVRPIPTILKGYLNEDGYRKVSLSGKSGRRAKSVNVHTLVLMAFVGPRPPGMEACHNDGNPANNLLENLRWDTLSGNSLDRLRHGKHPVARLVRADVLVIWERLVRGESSSAISEDFGVSRTTISLIKVGSTWSHITSKLTGWPLLPEGRNDKRPVYAPAEFCEASEEIWRSIPGWPAYRVSSFGNIQSCWEKAKGGRPGASGMGDTWRDITPRGNRDGHLVFSVSNPGTKQRPVFVHICVLTAFAGPRPPGMIACHNDGDPQNNHVSNLRWDTPAANARDRFEHARKRS
jgi:hypothetical protein